MSYKMYFFVKKNDKMHSMTYNDRKLFATKLNYFVYEKELLTIKHSFRF